MDFHQPDAKRFEYFFDQNERFLRFVEKYWRKREGRRANGPYYLRKVGILTGVSSEDYMAVQAADVYSWAVHTFCSQLHLREDDKCLPSALRNIFDEPISNWYCDCDFMRSDPAATRRVLESATAVSAWLYGL